MTWEETNHQPSMSPNINEAQKWIIFGDSHVLTIQHAYDAGWINRFCEFIWVGGATSCGLRNPNGITRALEAFSNSLLPPRSDAIPVMQLGEVDCGFVIWWRAAHLQEDVESQLKASVAAHIAFVDKLLAAGYRTVVLTGATVPTIRDGQDWGEIANKRREVTATLLERTKLTLCFNALLREEAERRSCPFVDITALVLDPETGTVGDAFRSPDPNDHHLNSETGGKLWANGLNAL